jgi:hypothetical protein
MPTEKEAPRLPGRGTIFTYSAGKLADTQRLGNRWSCGGGED